MDLLDLKMRRSSSFNLEEWERIYLQWTTDIQSQRFRLLLSALAALTQRSLVNDTSQSSARRSLVEIFRNQGWSSTTYRTNLVRVRSSMQILRYAIFFYCDF